MSRAKLGILTAVIVGAGASTALAGVAIGFTRTRAIIYQAFPSPGEPAIHVTRTARGSCNGGSAAIDRADAWRCFTGNYVYDPCFSSPKAKGIVLCPTGPWSGAAVKLKLTAPLTGANKGQPSTSGTPWAIETTAGAKCELATGATSILDHRRANYYCGKNRNVLWGVPSRKTKFWTIYSAPSTATRLTQKVMILAAWF